ncbi:MAG: late competence development ComFB family protein [Bacillaceae bacterium]|nr:late competence development ComFB family protein [Bacillaceae bacterium]
MKAVNMMESFVHDVIERNWEDLNMPCSCDVCKSDVFALTLNALPPRYAVTHRGDLYTRIQFLKEQFYTDVVREIVNAARVVAEKPLHDV